MIYNRIKIKWKNEWLKMKTKLNEIKKTTKKNGTTQCPLEEETKWY